MAPAKSERGSQDGLRVNKRAQWKRVPPSSSLTKPQSLFLFLVAILIFLRIRTLGRPLLGEKVVKEKERKNTIKSGHYILPATHLGPKIIFFSGVPVRPSSKGRTGETPPNCFKVLYGLKVAQFRTLE